jgi:hypothetical protein
LETVKWPGRLEVLNHDPLLVVDGAHNGDSAQKLAQALREVFHVEKWTLILGISADKDIAAILDGLLPLAERVIVTRASNARGTSIEALGAQVELLEGADLATGDFGGFDAIVIGVRAYAVRADLEVANARLLQYVHDGGTLIVQYQTPEFDRDFGPYPYKMGRNPEEVSEEDAQVTLLAPDHPLMTFPNRVTAADFDGWAEQRGSKFWQTWDERYVPLWECHDRGQPPQTGGMLYTAYGHGTYVYTAYAWYRQLPLGVPGAYRIVANLISQGTTRRGGK